LVSPNKFVLLPERLLLSIKAGYPVKKNDSSEWLSVTQHHQGWIGAGLGASVAKLGWCRLVGCASFLTLFFFEIKGRII